MKTTAAIVITCLALVVTGSAATKKKTRMSSTVPKYPKMIQIPKVPEVADRAPGKLITSELNGRDLKFFKDVISAGLTQELLGNLEAEGGK
jgi:hypothetical protein